jgi:hypothetical protein
MQLFADSTDVHTQTFRIDISDPRLCGNCPVRLRGCCQCSIIAPPLNRRNADRRRSKGRTCRRRSIHRPLPSTTLRARSPAPSRTGRERSRSKGLVSRVPVPPDRRLPPEKYLLRCRRRQIYRCTTISTF